MHPVRGQHTLVHQVQQQLKDRRGHETGGNSGIAFVLIYGASGYGKSSLMQAGVAPVVTQPGGVLDVCRASR